jgi:hypothetical protein
LIAQIQKDFLNVLIAQGEKKRARGEETKSKSVE